MKRLLSEYQPFALPPLKSTHRFNYATVLACWSSHCLRRMNRIACASLKRCSSRFFLNSTFASKQYESATAAVTPYRVRSVTVIIQTAVSSIMEKVISSALILSPKYCSPHSF
ncbi:hypothetical protein HCH_02996 [Hahella chejuensis KCTC 2396]|uniref:Uncharacterized protein n=1 Tax=Hahella chejuensis (strain KCTC 2396) TaxID=349521 RepID=Q2SHV9_HAHCH|nr:hypothetical protein HCH_02996 [Hahella chejuensis KCTC 2396]